ncbi:MAG: GyrI-like domain-containing protein [Flavobacteriaceae bacterium]|nr:GyrI-like domain-containing protein [Flavobacteriaceae bacterium]
MHFFSLVGGMYAVFKYRGSSENHVIYEVIFTQWLPSSSYQLEHRPHFEISGNK